MSNIPAQYSRTATSRLVRRNARGVESDQMGMIASDQTDSSGGHTPTYEFRSGNVVVLDTVEGKYVSPADAGAVLNAAAVVTASETADGDWASATISLYENGALVVTVTLGGADDTDAEVVTALNGNAIFAAHAKASAAGSRVVVTSLRGGSDVSIKVISSLATAFGATGTAAVGTDGDYRITVESCLLVSPVDATVAADSMAMLAVIGDFVSASMINLTAEAQSVLTRRGCRFI